MSQRPSSPSLRIVGCIVLAVLAAAALTACGSDDSQTLTFELGGEGNAAAFTGPETADAGETEITFANNTDGDGELQLIRVEGDRTPEDVADGLESATDGKPFPEWFFAGGGVGTTAPGESRTVTQVLQPGTYYAVNLEGEGEGGPDPETIFALEVSGEESDVELEADARVEAGEYTFVVENGLPAGETEIDFANIGAQPHHLIAAPIKGDATIEDIEKAFENEEGPPPVDEETIQTTAVIEGGESQLVDFDLEPGRYALLCFISDRDGGPPHALQGMIEEVTVE